MLEYILFKFGFFIKFKAEKVRNKFQTTNCKLESKNSFSAKIFKLRMQQPKNSLSFHNFSELITNDIKRFSELLTNDLKRLILSNILQLSRCIRIQSPHFLKKNNFKHDIEQFLFKSIKNVPKHLN